MRIRKLVAAVATCLLAAAGLTLGTSSVASATITACPGGASGWFDTVNGAVNCSIDGNHIVVDLYSPGGTYYYQGVADIWYDYNCDNVVFTGSTSTGFKITMSDAQSAYGCVLGSNGVSSYTNSPTIPSDTAPYQTFSDTIGIDYQYKQARLTGTCVDSNVSDTDGVMVFKPRGTGGWPYNNFANIALESNSGSCANSTTRAQMATVATVTYNNATP